MAVDHVTHRTELLVLCRAGDRDAEQWLWAEAEEVVLDCARVGGDPAPTTGPGGRAARTFAPAAGAGVGRLSPTVRGALSAAARRRRVL